MKTPNTSLPLRFITGVYASWWALVLYFQLFRGIIGLSYWVIYAYIIGVLIFFRIRIETLLIVFFVNSMLAYVTGHTVEANHYMSFVYAFMILTVGKQITLLIIKK